MMTGRYPATAASELSTPKARPAADSRLAPPLQRAHLFFVHSFFSPPFLSKREKGLVCFSCSVQNDLFQEAKLYERRILKSKYCLSDIE